MRLHKIVTAVAGTAILLSGAAACSKDDVDSAASNVSEAATDAASNVSEAASDASSNVSSAASDASSSASEGMEATTTATGAAESITRADLPESIVKAADEYKDSTVATAGEFKSAQKLGDAVLAEYENVSFVETPDSNGPQPIIGKIRETWVAGGGLENKIGLPVEPEHAIDNGWEQKFTKNTMLWTGENGKNFTDSYAK